MVIFHSYASSPEGIFHEASESPLPEINIKRLPIRILTSADHQTNRWGWRIEAQ